MKLFLLPILVLIWAGVLCNGQLDSGCNKPLELISCNTMAPKSADNFCSVLGEVRKCYEEKAQCPGDVFKKFQEDSEKVLGVKCGGCAVDASRVLALLALLGLGLLHRART